MGRGLGYLQSPATPEEDSYDYRVEWARHVESGCGGSELFHHDFDGAEDYYDMLRRDGYYLGLHLIKIYPDGSEEVWH